jgi:hypothetical protein
MTDERTPGLAATTVPPPKIRDGISQIDPGTMVVVLGAHAVGTVP